MAADSVVVVQQAPGGDRPIDNTEVDNAAATGGKAHRQRTEPYGARIARTQHLTEGALPAAGAYTDQAAFTIPFGITRVSYVVRYTRGDVDGYPRFQPLWGDGTDEANEVTLQATMTPAGSRARQRFYLQELDGPTPPNTDPLVYTLTFDVPAGMTTCRLLAAEVGDTDNPGQCGIAIVGGTPG